MFKNYYHSRFDYKLNYQYFKYIFKMSSFSDKVKYEISIMNNLHNTKIIIPSKDEYYFTNNIHVFINQGKTSYYPSYICSTCKYKFTFNQCQCYHNKKSSIVINNDVMKNLQSLYISKNIHY